jgi:imidazolonepropionase-like amidohydrolase
MMRIALIFLSFFTAPSAMFASPLLLKGGTICDIERSQTFVGDVLIRDGKVSQVGEITAQQAADAEIIDAKGKWIIPGLVDLHTHAHGNSAPNGAYQSMGIEGASRVMLYSGVTAFLDLLNDEGAIFATRNRQRSNGLLGADIFAAGPCLTAPNGHCSEYFVPTRIIESPIGGAAEIGEVAKLRPDFIKIVYDNVPGRRPTISRETLEAVVKAANAKGLKTVVHIGTWQDAHDAVNAGATAITHMDAQPIPEGLARLIAEKGVYVIPTVTVQSEIVSIIEDPTLLDDPMLQKVANKEVIDGHRQIDPNEPRLKKYIQYLRVSRTNNPAAIRALKNEGARILAGTDIANVATFVGYSLHRELQILVAYGLTPWEALRSATIEARNFLGQPAGLTPGADGSFLILNASPIENIGNTKNIHRVIFKGSVIDRDRLLQ